MQKSKIETYLGFCIRAGKTVFGVDSLETQRKGVFLIVCDGGLSENSLKNAQKAQERFACPLLLTEKDALGALLHRPTVKAVGIRDKGLAAAILSVAASDSQFKLYSGGTN